MSLYQIFNSWEKLWFTPHNPASICIFRIFFGIITFLALISFIPDFNFWYGNNAILSVDEIQELFIEPRFSLLFLPHNNFFTPINLLYISIIASITLTIGFFTRTSSLVLWLCLLSLHHRNSLMLNGADTLMRITCFLLIFSPCGKMFSINYLINKWQKKEHQNQWEINCYPWAQYLLRIQISLVYLTAVISKTQGEMWWNGNAIYYASKLTYVQKFIIPYIFDNQFICQIICLSTIALEFSLATLIWIREIRPWILVLGVLLHLSIELLFQIPFLSWLMIAFYINFLDSKTIKIFFDFISSKQFIQNIYNHFIKQT